ncbi:hypothetical protein CFP56_041309 [Quercus suber]|uniref:Uncharacterized protein n=1 Tax=Quercus suber TaxID=58331 RepID=A0AAW0LMG1_QUESU
MTTPIKHLSRLDNQSVCLGFPLKCEKAPDAGSSSANHEVRDRLTPNFISGRISPPSEYVTIGSPPPLYLIINFPWWSRMDLIYGNIDYHKAF